MIDFEAVASCDGHFLVDSPRWTFVTELCVLRTFGGVDFSLVFIC
eukprot:COSAG02_NODE_65962_length_256_cov_1.611465_1_plen_44_part_01